MPAESFCAPFFGGVYTHFNRMEKPGKSRLEDEINRLKVLLPYVCDNGLVLLNECFVGTRRSDALILSEKLFEKFLECGTTCGFVTHLYELPMRDRRLISFVAQTSQDLGEQEHCTYHIINRSPESSAHAHNIAIAGGATYEQLIEKIK